MTFVLDPFKKQLLADAFLGAILEGGPSADCVGPIRECHDESVPYIEFPPEIQSVEDKILVTLWNQGAMGPGSVSMFARLEPEECDKALKRLASRGLVENMGCSQTNSGPLYHLV